MKPQDRLSRGSVKTESDTRASCECCCLDPRCRSRLDYFYKMFAKFGGQEGNLINCPCDRLLKKNTYSLFHF